MGDQWEARLSVMKNIQEKFEHNIREMEEQLVRLTSLFEDMAVHPRARRPCHINRSIDHLSKLRAIRHVKLIALTCDNQDLQLRLLSWQHLNMPISQVVQGANLVDERLTRTNFDGTPSPSPTLSCSQS